MTPRDRPLATHFEDFLGEPLSGPSQLDELERQLRAELVRMNEEHRLHIKPLVDQLVRLQCLKPRPPMMETYRALLGDLNGRGPSGE